MIGRFGKWTTVVNWSALLGRSKKTTPPRIFVCAVAGLFLCAGCTGKIADNAEQRPGLGTTWGETRSSEVESVSFNRQDRSSPDVTATIFYNDQPGIERMIGVTPQSSDAPFTLPGGAIAVGVLRSDRGWIGTRFFPMVEHSGNLYVAGNKGERYAISLENRSKSKVEIVATVDGLDVIDGRSGSFSKPGYIIEAGEKTLIEGFRKSMDEIAAFRFGSVAESYAQKKAGDTINVGVIGIAVFREQGSPELKDTESRKRLQADPFPGQFASPPDGK